MTDRLKNQGLVLLELVIALSIMALLATTATLAFSMLQTSQALAKSSTLLISVLYQARSLTLGSKNNTQYGVHFETSKAVLFRGETYVPSDFYNVSSELDTSVNISSVALSDGGSEVLFERLTGKAVQQGSVVLVLNNEPAISKTITIYQSGLSEIN